MNTKLLFRIAFVGSCFFLSFEVTSAADSSQENFEYFRTCYVEKSKVAELMIRVNTTIQILNRRERFLKCWDQVKVAQVDPENIDFCTESRINHIEQELTDVVGRLLELAVQTEEPSKCEVLRLDKQKFDLIDKLAAMRVFYGPSPCDSSSIVIYPFGPLIASLETSLNQKLALFTTTRPPRLARNFTARKPGFEEMLNPENTFQQLLEMARLNPSAMSKAVSRIVALRYNERMSTFDKLVDFTKGLPTIENRINGIAAIYDEMFRYNRNPEAWQLEKLAKNLRLVIASAPTTLNVAAKSKLDELADDPDLRPLIFTLNPENSLQELADWAQQNPTATAGVLPQIISQRYNASDSQFEAILDFVEGLPTTENKIIGFVAVHDEMHRHKQTTNLFQLLKLAKKLKNLNEDVQASSTFANSAAELKWANLKRNLSPLMLIGENAHCGVTNVAYGTQLTANDWSSPQSAYVHPKQSLTDTWNIYPAIQNYKLVFRMDVKNVNAPLFASDTNTNTHSGNTKTKYQTKTSERYVLRDLSSLPTNAEIDWKLVAVPTKVNQFRILSAKYDDFMFAHKSATGLFGWRRVLLGKKGYSDHDHIANADSWTLDCEPG